VTHNTKKSIELPHRISKTAFIKLLVKHGWNENKARKAMIALLAEGIYRENGKALVLQEDEET